MKGDTTRDMSPRTRAGSAGRVSDLAHVFITDGDINRALKTFSKQVDRAKVLRELRRRETFTPLGERRRLKSRRARQRDAKTDATTSPRDEGRRVVMSFR